MDIRSYVEIDAYKSNQIDKDFSVLHEISNFHNTCLSSKGKDVFSITPHFAERLLTKLKHPPLSGQRLVGAKVVARDLSHVGYLEKQLLNPISIDVENLEITDGTVRLYGIAAGKVEANMWVKFKGY